MCDSRGSVPLTSRPAWSRLLAVLPVTVAVLALIESTVAMLPLRVAAEAAIVLATFGTMAMWVRANRSALDQLEVCGCARETLMIRVVEVRPSHSSRRGTSASLPAVTPVSASPLHRTGAKLRV